MDRSSRIFDEDSRKQDCSDVFVNQVMENQEVKSKGLAQVDDILGKFDELLGIWDDRVDRFSNTREQTTIIGSNRNRTTRER